MESATNNNTTNTNTNTTTNNNNSNNNNQEETTTAQNNNNNNNNNVNVGEIEIPDEIMDRINNETELKLDLDYIEELIEENGHF